MKRLNTRQNKKQKFGRGGGGGKIIKNFPKFGEEKLIFGQNTPFFGIFDRNGVNFLTQTSKFWSFY